MAAKTSIDPASIDGLTTYKLLTGSIVPRPIGFISTVSVRGVFNAAPFSFFNGISHHPPMLCFSSQRRDDREKDTLINVRDVGDFVANIVDEAVLEAMAVCAIDFPADISEFERAGLTPVASRVVRSPAIAEAPVNLECRVIDIRPLPESTYVRTDPLIIIAIAFYFSFAKLRLTGSAWSLVLAHAVLGIPKVFLIMTAALRGIDPRLELAAMSLGASRPRAVLSVTLPLAKAAVATSAILAFLTSFDEVVVAIFISGSTAVTLPKRMWDGIRLEYDPTITAVASLLITATVMTFVAVAALRARQPAAVGVASGRSAPGGLGSNA